MASANTARFAIVIGLPTVPVTEPVVLSASALVPVGEIGAVTLMFPEFVRSIAPILITLAVILFSSAFVIDSFPVASDPRSISRVLVRGLIVTGKVPPVTVTDDPIAKLSAVRETPESPRRVKAPVVSRVVLVRLRFPVAVNAPAVVNVLEAVSVMFLEEIRPEPVLTEDAALEIETSWPAVMVAEVLLKAALAPVTTNETFPIVELTFAFCSIEPELYVTLPAAETVPPIFAVEAMTETVVPAVSVPAPE
jgi:hypothetical protein